MGIEPSTTALAAERLAAGVLLSSLHPPQLRLILLSASAFYISLAFPLVSLFIPSTLCSLAFPSASAPPRPLVQSVVARLCLSPSLGLLLRLPALGRSALDTPARGISPPADPPIVAQSPSCCVRPFLTFLVLTFISFPTDVVPNLAFALDRPR